MDTSTKHIPALDGVRGLAILCVVLYHFNSDLYRPVVEQLGATRLDKLANIALGSGWAGVDLFFVLSGFLITGILDRAKGGPGYYRRFYTRRVLRIFPLYYAVLAGIFLVLPLFRPDLTAPLVSKQWWAWCYVSNIGDTLHGTWLLSAPKINLAHFWSLAIEEQFYLVWPTVILCLSRRSAIRVCAVLIVASLLLRIAFLLSGASTPWCYEFTFSRMDGLATGALVALASREWSFQPLVRIAPYLVIGASAVLLLIGWRHHVLVSFDPLMASIGFSALAALFAACVISAATCQPGSVACRFWCARPLRFLGKYSYGIYVFHMLIYPAFDWMVALVPRSDPIVGRLMGLLLCIAIPFAMSIAAALISWHLLEKRCLALKDRLAEPTPDRELLAHGQSAVASVS